jgi:hypothetical protein
MATLITKNSSTASSIPTAVQLVQGELAVNVTDKRLFTENSAGAVVELGTNPSSITTGTLTTTGNVGIGTSAPGAKLDVTVAGANLAQQLVGTSGVYSRIGTASSSFYTIHNGTTDTFLYTAEASALRFGTNSTERARIDSSGNLLVGTTVLSTFSKINTIATAGAVNGFGVNCTTAAATQAMVFLNPNGQVGSISVGGSATSYNTSSDYRLKNTIAPLTGALAKVALLKPVTYKWNADDSDGQGFIAHELAEVEPGCVSGEKDAVDAKGKPQYQGIDTSFLVATLAAAIQELKAIVDAQAVKIAALEAK